ncbi:carbamoyltransferase family protein [Methylocucumis oryzae]|uniref:carbamoyltransferase family protein n=1 Tax=Methylocucumis oryzae TaxID=1632867 RepID=UPI001EFA059A|nr:carbamoyltransferase C-terminal domain-containing protein [Methylocucumis oryzae]
MRTYDHHLTHAASACYSSGLNTAACAILDGYGEGMAYQSYLFQDNTLAPISNSLPKYSAQSASLGNFYMQICKLCGFGLFHGEEWKVMGLASYGKLDQKVYELLSPLICVEGLDLVQPDIATSIAIYQELANYRHQPGQSYLNVADLAFTAQQVFSERVYEYLSALHAVTKLDSVVLGGGCLLNSATNGKITEHTPFKHAHVFCAPGDDGNSVGAALLAYYQDHPNDNTTRALQSPYLGSSVSTKHRQTLQQFCPTAQTVEHTTVAKLAANFLAQGKIIGWMQGRAEFGPRALGNRSILADPRSESVKDRINAEIKFREAFRPFAPSILSDYGQDYFEDYQDSPYMERTLRFKPSVITKIPGVVHVDGTGRLQTVKREWNPLYYDLIAEFYRLTGIPLVLNTSFNVMGKPIIHSIEDALAVFYTSGLDVLIIENIVIEKNKP